MSTSSMKDSRILIVDDQESNLALLEGLLKKQGYLNYKSLSDPRQVLPTVQEWGPDLILLDLMMPHLDGFAVMQALKPLIAPDDYLPILVLTADVTSEAKRRALSGGAMDFLAKPFDATEVILRVGNLLQTRFLHRQLQNQNVLLEEKVVERTAQLERTHQKLESILNSAGEGIYGIDLEGRTTFMNPAALQMLGYSLDEMLGQVQHALTHHTHPDGAPYPREECPIYAAFMDAKVHRLDSEVFWRKDGSSFFVEYTSTPLWEGNEIAGAVVTFNDITERKQAEFRIQHLSQLYAILSQVNQAIVRVKDQNELFNTICRVAVDYGIFGLAWIGLLDPETGQMTPIAVQSAVQVEFPFQTIDVNQAPFKNGLIGSAVEKARVVYSKDIQGDPNMEHWRELAVAGGFHAAAAVPIQFGGEVFGVLNLYATDADFFNGEELNNLLEEISQDISFALETMESQTRRTQAEQALQQSEKQYRAIVEHTIVGVYRTTLGGEILYVNEALARILEFETPDEMIAQSIIARYADPKDREFILNTVREEGHKSAMDVKLLTRTGKVRNVLLSATLDGEILTGMISDITERKQAQDALREKEHLLAESQRIGHVGSWSYDILKDSLQCSDEMYRLFDVSPEEFGHNSEAFLELIYSPERRAVAKWMADIRAGRQASEMEFSIFRKNGEMRYIRCRGAVEFDFSGTPIRFIGTAQDVTERKLADLQIRQQIERLTTLREVDQAILSSFDLVVTLNIFLSHLVAQLHVDAADILLLEPKGNMLVYTAGKGFRTNAIESALLYLSDSQAVRERRPIHVETLENKPDPRLLTTLGMSESFVSYLGVPLIVKGKIKGVLEIFHRTPLQPYGEWLDFLNTMAGQAAIAIENATLFENLARSNRELSQAYDATIVGWSRALDLRDQETEGHTQRVTEMMLELARAFGLPQQELLYIRWGALLHDIGKMGVPDNVLLKPGDLTEEEWVLMKSHPQYAYDLLEPITFLAPALDIPYCHHEKWDGTGYPRGLKGEQIPLVARLFAIVDMWDALRSDRPYRKAWSVEQVREYILSQKGSHFDPRVVERFFEMQEE